MTASLLMSSSSRRRMALVMMRNSLMIDSHLSLDHLLITSIRILGLSLHLMMVFLAVPLPLIG